MHLHSSVYRFTRAAVGGAAMAFGTAAVGLAGAAPADRASITVFDDRYVVGNRPFDDLDHLERYIASRHIRQVGFVVCGAKATRSFKAVVHRFREIPTQVRVPDRSERECRSGASLVASGRRGAGQRPAGIDEQAVERYWRDLVP